MRRDPRAARVLRAEAGARAKAKTTAKAKAKAAGAKQQKSPSAKAALLLFGRARRALLLIFRGTHRLAAAVADQARRVGAGRADSAGYTDVPSAEPGRCCGPGAHDARWALGAGACFLLVTFLCTSKEKLPVRPKGERKPLLLNRNQDQDQELDSSLRWNDERERARHSGGNNSIAITIASSRPCLAG